MSASDLELLRATAGRDHEAFRQLVENHKEKVFRIALSLVRNQEEAEDLTQEVFLQVYKNAARFREESSVSTWIHRIAVNRSLNRLRKVRTQRWLQYFGLASQIPPPSEPVSESPDEALHRREYRELLESCLRRLPESQRIPFSLHHVEGVSYEEIAKILSCSVSAVESRIHRAKLNLQKYLAGQLRK